MCHRFIFGALFLLVMPFFVINCTPKSSSGDGADTDLSATGKVTVDCSNLNDSDFFNPRGYTALEPGKVVSIAPGLYQAERIDFRLIADGDPAKYKDSFESLGDKPFVKVNSNFGDLKKMFVKVSASMTLRDEEIHPEKGCQYFTATKKGDVVVGEDDLESKLLQKDLEDFFKGLFGEVEYGNDEPRFFPERGTREHYDLRFYFKTEALVHGSQVLTVFGLNDIKAYRNKAGDLALQYYQESGPEKSSYVIFMKKVESFDLAEVYGRHSDVAPEQTRFYSKMSSEELEGMTSKEIPAEFEKRGDIICAERLAKSGWYGPFAAFFTDSRTIVETGEQRRVGYCSPKIGYIDEIE